jgi:hypothetical protein
MHQQMCDEKFGINCQLRNKYFLVVVFHFSLLKVSMNAPHLSNLIKDNFYRHWPWRNGVNKTLPFLHFPIAKGGTKTIAHLPIAEGSSFLCFDRRNYNCKLRNGKKDCSEFSPQTSKLLLNRQLKKHSGALIL